VYEQERGLLEMVEGTIYFKLHNLFWNLVHTLMMNQIQL